MNPPHQFNNQKSPDKNPAFTPAIYEICIEGRLGLQIATWFENMTLTVNEETDPLQTIIRGYIVDQAALYGLISRARDLGLTLVSVSRIKTEAQDAE